MALSQGFMGTRGLGTAHLEAWVTLCEVLAAHCRRIAAEVTHCQAANHLEAVAKPLDGLARHITRLGVLFKAAVKRA